MSRVLVLSAGFGEGHNAAARSLVQAFEAEGGPGTARFADLFHASSPRLNALARRAYIWIINRHPGLWSRIYAWAEGPACMPGGLRFMKREMALLESLVRREGAEILCSSYPVYAFMAEALAASGRLKRPLYNVVTDSITINRLWSRPACDGWFVPNPETAEVIERQGVAREKIHDLGFPVHAFFAAEGRGLEPPSLSWGATPRVLVIMNSGVRHAEVLASCLLRESRWDLSFAVGRDEVLRRRLLKLAEGRRARTDILGWTDQIPRLLLTHHVVVSKAGGATTQEAIAARCPMIVSQVVPGQEEGNYELLRRRGIGARAETPHEVMASLEHAFAGNGRIWSRWRDALGSLSRPQAARDIAHKLLGRSQQ